MKLLKEAIESLDEQTSTVVGGHTGRGGRKGGMRVDDIWAGGFEATDEVIRDLEIQLHNRKEKRKAMEDNVGKHNIGVEHPLGGYHDIETPTLLATYDYLDALSQAKIKYSNDSTPQNDMYFKPIEKDYQFDKNTNNSIDKEKFINRENRMKYVDETSYYDKLKKDLYNKEKFVNNTDYEQNIETEIEYDKVIDKTEENKKFINDTNGWKSIYENEKY